MDSARARILVVDDDLNNVDMLRRRLERHKYLVDVAHSGAEALERIGRETYDTVLLDTMMPGLSGIDVLCRIRADAAHKSLPVVMVTALADTKDIVVAFEKGASDYVSKPIEFPILLARLEIQLTVSKNRRLIESLNGVLREIVAQRTENLAEANTLIDGVVATLPIVIWGGHFDAGGEVVLDHLQGAVNAVFGVPENEICAIPGALTARIHQNDRQALRDTLQRAAAQHETLLGEARLCTTQGEQRWIYFGAAPAGEGRLSGIFLDITERKRIEAQMFHNQKLESVGQLASGIAHEINSPAQFTRDNIVFLKDSFAGLSAYITEQTRLLAAASQQAIAAEDLAALAKTRLACDLDYVIEEMPKALDQSLDGIDRISRIVTAMKGFTHPGSNRPEPCDLNKLIEDTVVVASNEWKYVANLQMNLDPLLPPVACFASELSQAILNLVVNAAHAIQEAAGRATAMGHIVVASRFAPERDAIVICVSDDGPGVPEHVRAKIFDPFFTTKPVGKGTGQGLAIARAIVVVKHGGTLDLDTTPHIGATFVITLPFASAQEAA